MNPTQGLQDLTLFKHLLSVCSPFAPHIVEVYNEIKDVLNTRIPHVFPHYTLHDTSHSFRVIEYMSEIVEDYTKLSDLEIALLIYSALLHDIGMAVSQVDIDDIKSGAFVHSSAKYSAMKTLCSGDETIALQEYVRMIHASLSAKYIREVLKGRFTIPGLSSIDFNVDLALICESHTEGFDWIRQRLNLHSVKGDYPYNSQYVACILRLADILDIDSNRTPYRLYKLIDPQGISNAEWKQNFTISNNKKIVVNPTTSQKRIVFHGESNSAGIHRKILVYASWVESEFTDAIELVAGMADRYALFFNDKPDVFITPIGYTFSDYRMTLEFKAISSLLMGEKIYGDKTLGLRELIQNSIDSCKLRQEIEAQSYEFGQDEYRPKIKVILDKSRNQAIVKDNGTGMSMAIIKKHFLNIGVSYYKSREFILKEHEYKPIGNYGIGFLACFMLSSEVMVATRHYRSRNKYLIQLESGNEWTSLTEVEDLEFDGTEVILSYTEFIKAFEHKVQAVKAFLMKYFITDGIEFELIDRMEKVVHPVSNPIERTVPEKGSLVPIQLRDYLIDFEGLAFIKRRSRFISKFEEIDFYGTLYRYDDEDGLVEVDDYSSLRISDYLNGNEIKYLAIPLVDGDTERDYLNGLKFTENDVEEVIEKMDRDMTWISIIVPQENQSQLITQTLSKGDYLFDNLGFADLVALGHSKECTTRAFEKTKSLFEGRINELYLPFETNDNVHHYWRPDDNRWELFIRNVLIKDFKYRIPITAGVFEIVSIVANIHSRKVIPDVSRNNIDSKASDMIGSAVAKAIHNGALTALSLTSDENATLSRFIEEYYGHVADLV
ncbi:MAG: ATP-binding protein [bacterium]|nr:ATP-binding protein [bacterium]